MNIHKASLTGLTFAAGVFVTGNLDIALGQWPPEPTYPTPVNTYANVDDSEDEGHRVTTDGNGVWVATWSSQYDLNGTVGTDWDCFFARSTNNGLTWSDAAPLNTNAATDSGRDWPPAVAADGHGKWVAVWLSSDDLGGTIGTDWDLLISCSTDNAVSWTDPAPLKPTANTDTTDEWGADIATDRHGIWIAVWPSWDDLGQGLDPDWDVLFSLLVDDCATWSDPRPVNNNAASDSGSDNGARVATDGEGTWVVLWGSDDSLGGTIGTDGDTLYARSTNAGATWTDPQPLIPRFASDNNHEWSASVGTDGQGTWIAAWESWDDLGGTIGPDSDILFSRSTDNGETWEDSLPLNTYAYTDSRADSAVWLAATPLKEWAAVWYTGNDPDGTIGSDYDILISHSTDDGLTWTNPSVLNCNAASDSGDDYYPVISTDARGQWVTIWLSNDDLGGIIESDWDILATGFHVQPIPTVSEWGLFGMTVLLVVAGALVLKKRLPRWA